MNKYLWLNASKYYHIREQENKQMGQKLMIELIGWVGLSKDCWAGLGWTWLDGLERRLADTI